MQITMRPGRRVRVLHLSSILLAVVWFALAESPLQASSRQNPASPVEVPEVQLPPRLEDFLGETPAVPALRIDTFVQRHPGDGTPASEETIAYLSHDRSALYVVFVCRDRDPQNIRARLTRREDIIADDLVGVLLDTFHDRRRAYVFLVNPRGIQRDAILTEGLGEDVSYDTLWESRGQITSTGYVVWMAIPFKSILFSSGPGSGSTWGIGLTRRIPRTTEEVFWPAVSRSVEGTVPQLAPVEGFRNLTAGQNVSLIPYGAFADARFLEGSQGSYRTARDARGGLDVKAVWRDSLAVDLTANPDFSHVETDDPQVTINQRFEVFLPEKRPFFLENAATFQTPETLFFSRRIVSPRWGTRLTGKAGGWNIGSLVAEDRVVEDTSPAGDALIGVVRVQREIGRESTIGALLTSRDAGDIRNNVASIDARIRLAPQWTFQAQAVRSSQDGDASSPAGTAVVAELNRTGRHLTLVNRYLARSPSFVTQLGFVPRTDIRQAFQLTTYRWRPKSGTLLAFGPGLTSSVIWDYDGEQLDRNINPHFGFEFRGATQVLVGGFDNRETFGGHTFQVRAGQVHVSSAWLKWMELAGFFQAGTRINYAPAAGLAAFLADTTDAFARVTLRPSTAILFEQSYIYTQLQATRAAAEVPHTGRIFVNHLARSKLSVQVTRELSVRAILDYGEVASDPSLTSVLPRKRVSGDLLATYQLNPWTAIYLGYTDGSENLHSSDSETLPPPRRFQRTERQVFAKASYVLRF
jgi:hypothetical protein